MSLRGLVTFGVGVAKTLFCELEVRCFFLLKVGEVEDHTNKVRLSRIIALIFVIVDDQIVSLILGCRNVLEFLEVEGVSEDVVGVNTLKGLALGLSARLQALELPIGKDA